MTGAGKQIFCAVRGEWPENSSKSWEKGQNNWGNEPFETVFTASRDGWPGPDQNTRSKSRGEQGMQTDFACALFRDLHAKFTIPCYTGVR